MTLFTVLGSSGFIGSHLTRQLRRSGFSVFYHNREDNIPERSLGNIICCVGLTADFRAKPFETVEAHVSYLITMLKQCKFDSFMYLSSTRIYGIRDDVARENDVLHVEPLRFDDIYNISKIMGESACCASKMDNVRVVRLSNVYGYDPKSENFVFTLIRDALKGKIVLNTTLDSCKDHVSVDDIVRVLPLIALQGQDKLYNVASGTNRTVGQISTKLSKLTGCIVEVNLKAQRTCSPKISIERLRSEFAFNPTDILDNLEPLIKEYKKHEETKQ